MQETEIQKEICSMVEKYLLTVNDDSTSDIYKELTSQVEYSLFSTVLKHTKYNQTVAASILGISRTTLRKKMKQYKLL